ncbi:MAG: hypothetical protein ACE1ZA_01965, partial [Pseudomonadales bacterium]
RVGVYSRDREGVKPLTFLWGNCLRERRQKMGFRADQRKSPADESSQKAINWESSTTIGLRVGMYFTP